MCLLRSMSGFASDDKLYLLVGLQNPNKQFCKSYGFGDVPENMVLNMRYSFKK